MRRNVACTRRINPDAKYNDVLMAKFINKLMFKGKKYVAEQLFYTALENAAKEKNQDPKEFFGKVLENSQPSQGVFSRRIGGASYQVPFEIDLKKRPMYAINFNIKSMRVLFRQNANIRTSIEALKNILIQSFDNTGPAVTMKEELHKKAVENAAFAHYRKMSVN